MLDDEEVRALRQRIGIAYDSEQFRQLAGELADQVADHFEQVLAGCGPVLPWRDPVRNIATARDVLDASDHGTGDLGDRFSDIIATMLRHGHNLHHPRYIGHQVPPPVLFSGLFDAVGAMTNQVMAIYDMGPFATAVEHAMIERIGETVGFPKDDFGGLITHGGSLANLTGLLTARNVAVGDSWEHGVATSKNPPVIVVHSDAHYGVTRSAGIIGLGTGHVIRAALDERRRMDPNQLDDQLKDLRARDVPIVAVVGCACATPIGAFDDLNAIADVCERNEVWLHVDAAHGGAACLSTRHRHLVSGMHRCDSVILDAHKMLFVPGLCAFVFYKQKSHVYETFKQDAPYLFDPAAPGQAQFDSGMRTVECTKRAAAFALWGVWAMMGKQLFADLVDLTFDSCKRLYQLLQDADDFQTIHEPQCNILAFRYRPPEMADASDDEVGAFQFALRRRIIESGKFYIVSASIDGVGALRVTVINPLTQPTDLHALLATIRETGSAMHV